MRPLTARGWAALVVTLLLTGMAVGFGIFRP